MSVRRLLERSLPGGAAAKERQIRRGEKIAHAINGRWHIQTPYQWQAKHLRWWLETQTMGLSADTKYAHWLTCRNLAAALNHWPDWEPHLKGDWNPHQRKGEGGRPPKLPGKGRTPQVRGKRDT